MGLATKQRKTWLCPKCGTRNEVIPRSRKCQNTDCGEMSRPIKRQAKHKAVLRGDTYPLFFAANAEIHGVTDGSCGVCGKRAPEGGRHDRDHGHRKGEPDYGKPRGLACGGNQGCNILMVPWVTAATAKGIAAAKRAKGERDAERWEWIAAYLERSYNHYAKGDEGE